MPARQQYLFRGNIIACLDFMLTHWRAKNEGLLSILHHVDGRYYAVVNDDFLLKDTIQPEIEGTRLMLRCSLTELKKICRYYHNSQTRMDL